MQDQTLTAATLLATPNNDRKTSPLHAARLQAEHRRQMAQHLAHQAAMAQYRASIYRPTEQRSWIQPQPMPHSSPPSLTTT